MRRGGRTNTRLARPPGGLEVEVEDAGLSADGDQLLRLLGRLIRLWRDRVLPALLLGLVDRAWRVHGLGLWPDRLVVRLTVVDPAGTQRCYQLWLLRIPFFFWPRRFLLFVGPDPRTHGAFGYFGSLGFRGIFSFS